MKELDDILNRHLPDAGLCKNGQRLNRQRKARLKADLLAFLKPDTDRLLIVDEQLLGITPMNTPPKPVREPVRSTHS